MNTTHGSLSSQAVTRLQGGEWIRKEFDNDEIVDIIGRLLRLEDFP